MIQIPLRALLGALTSVCLATAAFGQASSDVQINSTTAGDQTQVDVGIASDAREVVSVWTSESSSDPSASGDVEDTSVAARRFRVDDQLFGPQIQVNTTTAGFQFVPAVAVRDDGSFAVAWASGSIDAGLTDIVARLYDGSDAPVTGEISVNDVTGGPQSQPAIAFDRNAGFVVAWQSGTGPSSIQARRFDAAGAANGSQFTVSPSANDQERPAIAFDAAGNFVIAFEEAGGDGDGAGVIARLFPPDCNNPGCAGVTTVVDTSTVGDQGAPAVASLPGGFVIVWESEESTNARDEAIAVDDQNFSIQARRFDAALTPLQDPFCPDCDTMTDPMCEPDPTCEDGNDFQVNTYVTSEQRFPDVASSTTGEFTVVWDSLGSSGDDDSLFSIQSRRYDSNGRPVDSDLQVNSFTTSSQTLPAVASFALEQRLQIAWQSRRSPGDDDSGLSIVPEPARATLAIAAVAALLGLRSRRRPES